MTDVLMLAALWVMVAISVALMVAMIADFVIWWRRRRSRRPDQSMP